MLDATIPHIPLKEAHLCMNCDIIYTWRDNKNGCPGCAGTISMHLVRIIALWRRSQLVRVCKQLDCDNEFEPKSRQELNCVSCSAKLKAATRVRSAEATKSLRLCNKKKAQEVKIAKKAKMTNKEQAKIDKAVWEKLNFPTCPGRIIKGEEFEQLRRLYDKK